MLSAPVADRDELPPAVPASLLRNAAIVGLAFVASRLLGLVREVIVAAKFGTTGEYDAYVAAFRVPDLLFQVIMAAAFGSAFIPIFAGFLERKDKEAAWRLASTVLNLSAILLTVAALITFALAGPVMRYVLLPGYSRELQQLGTEVMRILLLSPVLLGLAIASKGILEAQQRFTLPAFAPIFYNLGIIFGAVALSPALGVKGLAWGVVIGGAGHLLVQLPGLIGAGMRYAPTIRLDTPGLASVARLLGPRVIGQAAFIVNFIVVTIFASHVAEERVSALNYAWQLLMLPHGVVALSISTVVFPSLARLYERRDFDGIRATFAGALRPLVFLSLPAAVALFAFRSAIVQVLLERGEFDRLSRSLTVDALAFFAIGLVPYAVTEVLTRVFYGMHDAWTPVLAGVVTIALNVALCAILVGPLDISGLALSLSVTTTVEGLALLIVLRRRLGRLVPNFGDWLFRVSLATVAMAGVAALLAQPLADVTRPGEAPFLVRLGFLIFALALAGGAYVGTAHFVELPEPGAFAGRIAGRLGPLAALSSRRR
jgi:putative peptidoglycan lipid II flippase